MRVSNTVKDYIRHELEKKYPTDNLPEYDAVKEASEKFIEELDRKVASMVESELAAFVEANPNANGVTADDLRRSRSRYDGTFYMSFHNAKINEANLDYVHSMHKKREAAFEKIVATLELGGNKDDLERMLAELN